MVAMISIMPNARAAMVGFGLSLFVLTIALNVLFLSSYPRISYDALRFQPAPPLQALLKGRTIEYYPGAASAHRIVTDGNIWDSFRAKRPVLGTYADDMEEISVDELQNDFEIRILFEDKTPVLFIFSRDERDVDQPLRIFSGSFHGIAATLVISEQAVSELSNAR
jgi:hypothetical protein